LEIDPPRLAAQGSWPPPSAHTPLFHLMGCDLPIYLMIVSAAQAALFFRREQERAGSLSRARLEALRAQLQPHFLFNTLNAIAGLVYHEPAKADAMLTALSDLLRSSLKTSDTQELPLAQEMIFVKRYLDIMRARFEDRLNFRLEIGSDVRAALVPSLLLQPLVESAVRHGLEPQPAGGLITVRAWREGGALRLTVEDNGAALKKSRPTSEGAVIGNARARLRELYGNRATFELRNGLGVIADISLPFRTAPPPLAA
jgi:two-component system LytT family sensor kinase